jgi:hypothetical protein
MHTTTDHNPTASDEALNPAQQPSAPRRSRRALALVATLAIGLFAGSLVGGTALASHQFPDVSDNSQFHDEIDWMVDHGIATGFQSDGTFRPGQAVSRQAMAAFMSRFNDAFVVRQSSVDPGSGSTHNHTTVCNAGERALAGGGRNDFAGSFITETRPNATGDGWTVVWETEANSAQDPTNLTVWVLCAPQGIT